MHRYDIYCHHVVVSPPQNLEYALVAEAKTPEKKRILDKLFEEVKALLERVGACYGGYIIFHPFRLKGENEKTGENLEKEIKKWKKVLKKPNWQDYVKFSPHFHCFVVAEFVYGGRGKNGKKDMVTEKIYRETGWIVRRITKPNSKVSLGKTKDLARSLLYCMSHMGILPEKYRTARWFGELASFVPYKKSIKEFVTRVLVRAQGMLRDAPKFVPGKVIFTCPKCNNPLKLIVLKESERSVLEKVLSLRQTKAPPPPNKKQDKNG